MPWPRSTLGAVGGHRAVAVPPPHLRVQREVGDVDRAGRRRRGLQRELIALGAVDLGQRAEAALHLGEVVRQLHPAAVLEPGRPSRPGLFTVSTLESLPTHVAHTDPLSLRVHVAGGARRAGGADLDAVVLVVEAAVRRRQRHDAVGRGRAGRIGAHGERARRRVRLGGPARRVVGAGDVGAGGAGVEQAHLPHRLGTRGGVRAAEGDLAQGRVLDDAQVPGPHVDVGDVHARVGRRRRRPPLPVGTADDGRAGRQVGLGEHRRERLVLAEHTVDVVAPGRQRRDRRRRRRARARTRRSARRRRRRRRAAWWRGDGRRCPAARSNRRRGRRGPAACARSWRGVGGRTSID